MQQRAAHSLRRVCDTQRKHVVPRFLVFTALQPHNNPVLQSQNSEHISWRTNSLRTTTAFTEDTETITDSVMSSVDVQATISSDEEGEFYPDAYNSEHLREYIEQHADLNSVIMVKDAGKQGSDPDVVKSLVIVVEGQPWVAVLRGADKMDYKKVATCLGVSRRQVRLAKRSEAVEFSGFVPGTVPPLGHKQPLPTIVDARVMQLGGLLYAGGGCPHIEMVLNPLTLATHTHAQILDVAVGPAFETHAGPFSSDTSNARKLPLPWPAGSTAVEMVGIIALKRRVAKVLQFCTIVPEDTPSLPPSGQAMYLRRLWGNPGAAANQHATLVAGLTAPQDGDVDHVHDVQVMGSQSAGSVPDACEVQLIMGKTLERKLGREEAIALMDRIKPGNVVRVTGVVQPHGPPADYVPTPNSRAAKLARQQEEQQKQQQDHDDQDQYEDQADSRTGGIDQESDIMSSADGKRQRPSVVLDVVCHNIEIIYRGRDRLERDLGRARRNGFQQVKTAADLLKLKQWKLIANSGSSASAAAAAANAARRAAAMAEGSSDDSTATPTSSRDDVASLFTDDDDVASDEDLVVVVEDNLRSNHQPHGNAKAAGSATTDASSGGEASDTADAAFWSLGIDMDKDVEWIDTLQGVQHVRQIVAVQAGQYLTARQGNPTDSSTSTPVVLPPPVGIDCEWVPYDKGEAATPVALLQIAMRNKVYLLDLLALAHSSKPSNSDESQNVPPSHNVDGISSRDVPVTAQQDELGQLLRDILVRPGVTALGFGLSQDLTRLVQSYHWLYPYLTPMTSSQTQTAIQESINSLSISDSDEQQSEGYSDAQRATSDTAAAHASRGNGTIPGPVQHLESSQSTTGVNGVTYVDVLKLARAAQPEVFLMRFGQPHQMSLARVVQQVFGRPLDKSCQRSDWGQRPLSSRQLSYAAADALSLVALHDALLKVQTK